MQKSMLRLMSVIMVIVCILPTIILTTGCSPSYVRSFITGTKDSSGKIANNPDIPDEVRTEATNINRSAVSLEKTEGASPQPLDMSNNQAVDKFVATREMQAKAQGLITNLIPSKWKELPVRLYGEIGTLVTLVGYGLSEWFKRKKAQKDAQAANAQVDKKQVLLENAIVWIQRLKDLFLPKTSEVNTIQRDVINKQMAKEQEALVQGASGEIGRLKTQLEMDGTIPTTSTPTASVTVGESVGSVTPSNKS